MESLYVDADYVASQYVMTGVVVIWGEQLIFIPRFILTLVQSTPSYVYTLDINDLRLALKDLEDNDDGMSFLDTHRHNTTVTLSGTVYARVVEIINGYTITFEDGQYAVNLIGANSNIADVLNLNQVSVRTANSAGLIEITTPGEATDIANEVWSHTTGTAVETKLTLMEKILRNKTVTNPSTGVMTVYDDDGTTILLQTNVYQDVAGSQPYQGQGADRKDRLA